MIGRRRVHEDGVSMLETKGGLHNSINQVYFYFINI